jgi:hypothetical protein
LIDARWLGLMTDLITIAVHRNHEMLHFLEIMGAELKWELKEAPDMKKNTPLFF